VAFHRSFILLYIIGKFPDFQAARNIWTVDGTRKWAAGDDWFYDIKDRP
jgi:hypothetical protein